MTTTAFQVIFDRAETISINKRPVTSQTISRDQTVRTVSRGGQVWRFEVKLPDGIPWDEMRPYIEAIDNNGRITTGTVQITGTGYNTWFTKYQGDSVNSTGFAANVIKGYPNVTLSSSPTTSSGFKFKAGDLIQLGSTGNVYSVSTNVAFNSNLVELNRPVIDSNATAVSLSVGPSVTWKVVCTQLPTWTIFAKNQVSWSGPFIFYEALV